MCGIVGFVTRRPVVGRLMRGLSTLEYRGYDSAGVAVVRNGQFQIRRAVGKLVNLQQLLERDPIEGNAGIGHTRWATHGGAVERNSHPHASRQVVVVHNGIIENFAELKEFLERRGFSFASQTDTEVIAHLIQLEFDSCKDRLKAVAATIKQLKGAYAFAAVFCDAPNELYAVSRGAPLSLGLLAQQGPGEKSANEFYVASDPLAFCEWANYVVHLHEQLLFIRQSYAGVQESSSSCTSTTSTTSTSSSTCSVPEEADPHEDFYKILDFDLNPSSITIEPNRLSSASVSKGSYAHFMLKEIYEQPRAFSDTVAQTMQLSQQRAADLKKFFSKNEVTMIACGTSFHACCIGRYLLEKLAGIKTHVELASEFLYRSPVVSGSYIFVSQSGETRDTVACHELVKTQDVQTLCIVNVPTSQLARKADLCFPTAAGPEIGVASTKAFTAQIAVLAVLVMSQIQHPQARKELQEELARTASGLQSFLSFVRPSVEKVARAIYREQSAIFLGRGLGHSVALEAALKLKELCYVHADGYAAGELKHGPIALIDDQKHVIVFVSETTEEKIVSNIQEVSARGGKCWVVGKEGSIVIKARGELEETVQQSCVLQLLAYECAVLKGVDVDQPRNLAKCVTVE